MPDALSPADSQATAAVPSEPPAPGQGRGEPPEPIRRRRWWHGKDSRGTPERPCLNCGDATYGNYCPTCGQRKVDVRISLRGMLREVMDDQLSLNSTLPRTLAALFFHPGHLTREYVQGRIMRYIPPFRLYLVSSLVFFIILPLVADPGEMTRGADSGTRADSVRAARTADSVLLVHARRTGEDTLALARAMARSHANPSQNNLRFGPEPEKVPPILKPLARRMKRTEARLKAMPQQEALRTLITAFEDNAPIGVFVMMPLFALILKLLYVRRKRFYVEHFVFALHVHAFAFLTGVVLMLSSIGLVDAAIMIWFMVYLFMALKRVYGQGAVRTFLKYVALGMSYSFLLVFGVTATVLMTALSL
jgi:hypothetical protein